MEPFFYRMSIPSYMKTKSNLGISGRKKRAIQHTYNSFLNQCTSICPVPICLHRVGEKAKE
jgi:hypothetical protein